MKPRLLVPLGIFILLVVLLVAGLYTADQRQVVVSPLVGKSAPAFDLPDLFEPGESIDSKTLHGEPWLLNVWGSWCYACRLEHPWIERLGSEADIPLIGFNLRDERGDALRWLERFGDPWTLHVRDFEGLTSIEWGVYGAPETFLIDADGIIRHKIVGPLDEETFDDLMLRVREVRRDG